MAPEALGVTGTRENLLPTTDSDARQAAHRKGSCRCCRLGCLAFSAALIICIILTTIHRASEIALLHPFILALQESEIACRASKKALCESCSICFSSIVMRQYEMPQVDAAVLGVLFAQLAERNTTVLKDFLQGAHVVLADDTGSWMYDFLKSLPGAHARISSHRSDRDAYGIPLGSDLQSLLWGTLGKSTWVQLEGHHWDPLRDPLSSFRHAFDYVKYKISGRNVGPLGYSVYTDRNPLILTTMRNATETCSSRMQCEAPSATSGVAVQI
eukprot:TRINITY_DN3988_c0_g1_i1.p1 TRINITY_DN3988_c0_g1~~TRINITY_DN3988_c0_g1_i1.p1  ORF type:complete len:271 (-),score=26.44 TRINITY_DN3988_c0_g1_i1:32-844(-)